MPPEPPAVTVVLPTFNRADMLAEGLDALAAQTFAGWHLVCVDDGSTDRNREVVEAFAARVPQPVEYVYQPNQGPGAARRNALTRVRGEFVAFMDSDDPWLPHHLAECLGVLRRHPDVDWVLTPAQVVDLRCGRVLRENSYRDAAGRLTTEFQRVSFARREEDRVWVVAVPPGKMAEHVIRHGELSGLQGSVLRRWVTDRVSVRPYRLFDDVAFHIEALAAGARQAYLPAGPHLLYRIHDANTSLVNDDAHRATDKRAAAMSDGAGVFRELMAAPGFTRGQRRRLGDRLAWLLAWDLGYNTYQQHGRPADARRALRQSLAVRPLAPRVWKAYLASYRRPPAGDVPAGRPRVPAGLVRTATAASVAVARLRPHGRRVLVASAPVPERNRGDQALLAVVLDRLRRAGRPITVLATSGHPFESLPTDDPGVRAVTDLYPLFMTDRAARERVRFPQLAAGHAELAVIGADVLDEGYSVERSAASLYAVRLAARVGLRARIFGFSVNGPPSPTLAGRLRQLGRHCRLMARDPESVRRLHAAGVPGVEPVGDLAYLLDPAPADAVPAAVSGFVAKHPGRVIGLNLTEVVFGLYGRADERLAAVAAACRELAETDGYRFLLLPHDVPEGAEYLRGFAARLAPGTALLVDPVPDCRVLKRIAGLCRHVFTCRLHLGIAALGMGRPVSGFPYQGKWEGQFELFGLSVDGLMGADRFPDSAAELAGWMRGRLAASDELAAQIARRWPAVKELAERNFDGLTAPGVA